MVVERHQRLIAVPELLVEVPVVEAGGVADGLHPEPLDAFGGDHVNVASSNAARRRLRRSSSLAPPWVRAGSS